MDSVELVAWYVAGAELVAELVAGALVAGALVGALVGYLNRRTVVL